MKYSEINEWIIENYFSVDSLTFFSRCVGEQKQDPSPLVRPQRNNFLLVASPHEIECIVLWISVIKKNTSHLKEGFHMVGGWGASIRAWVTPKESGCALLCLQFRSLANLCVHPCWSLQETLFTDCDDVF